MIPRWILVGLIWMVGAIGSGCAPRPVVLHPDFGVVYESVTDAQILTQQPGDPREPVVGMDGYAGVTVMYAYRKSFEYKEDTSYGKSIVAGGVQTK